MPTLRSPLADPHVARASRRPGAPAPTRRRRRPARRRRRRRSRRGRRRAGRRSRSAARAGSRRARRSAAIDVELALEGRGVAGHRPERRHHRVHLRDEHAVGAAEAADHLLHLVLRDAEAVGRDVGRLHRRARVDQHDDRAPLDEALGGARIAERQDEQRQQRELEQQREEPLELREEARRLLVAKDALPERRERHRHDAPAQLEDVEHGHADARRRRRSPRARASGSPAKIIVPEEPSAPEDAQDQLVERARRRSPRRTAPGASRRSARCRRRTRA